MASDRRRRLFTTGSRSMSQLATKSYTLTLWLPGKVAPKARPRFNSGQAYLPQNYRGWKRDAVIEVLCQISKRLDLPLTTAKVEVLLSGKHRGDLDNLAGSILDVLVEAGVLVDDRVNCVQSLLVTYKPIGECGARVTVTQLED